MKRFITIFSIIFLILPLFAVSIWYCVSFLPYLSEITAIEKEGKDIVTSAPPILYKIAVAAESIKSIRTHAIAKVYWNIVFEVKAQRPIFRQFNEMLWLASSYIHFSNEQAFYLWACYAVYESGHGLGNASMYYFNKPLSELNEESLVALVVASRNPSRFKPGTERSEERIKTILKILKES